MSVEIPLLQQNEPAPVAIERRDGASPFVIICDHAGDRIPRTLGTLGLPASELRRHIAWDIGAGAVATRLGALLDAPVVKQVYSRLVIDCNRSPGHPTSIAPRSEATDIQGNLGLSEAEKEQRLQAIFAPYHDAITALLDERQQRGHATILIAQHSFTPVFLNASRIWQAGMLYHLDGRLSHALGALIREEGFVVGDNEPYVLTATSDYSIPFHAEGRDLPYVEIELRQDLITEEKGQADWAKRLARLLPIAAKTAFGI